MVCASALALLPLLAGLRRPVKSLLAVPVPYRTPRTLDCGQIIFVETLHGGHFNEGVTQTEGVVFSGHFVEIEFGVQVKLQFWDTAG